MGADKSAENTSNAPEFICTIYLPKPTRPKVLDFNEKRLHWASVIRNIRLYQLIYKHETQIFSSFDPENY
jgi:hypothetical protein